MLNMKIMNGDGKKNVHKFSDTIIDNLPEAVGVLDGNRRFVYCNNSMLEMFGYSPDDLDGLDVLSLVEEKHRMEADERLNLCMKEEYFKSSTWDIEKKDGSFIPCEINCRYFKEGGQNFISFFITDISEKNELERMKNALDDLYHRFGADPDTNIDTITARACKILNGKFSVYNGTDFVGSDVRIKSGYNLPVNYKVTDRPIGFLISKEMIDGKTDFIAIKNLEGTDYENSENNLSRYNLKAFIGRSVNIRDKRIGALCVLYDKPRNFRKEEIAILNTLAKALSLEELRKESETDLRRIIQEKEFLMKEINHRVKNNLMMITSLIKLKENSSDSGDFSDLIHQIDAIRIVHEILYTAGDVKNIEIKGYYKKLIDTIFESFTTLDISVTMDIEDITMNTRQLVTSGLIINEIATNSIKYAYQGCEKPEFRLIVKVYNGDDCEMHIGNNGTPIPDEINLNYPKTLGMRLISALTKQLNGSVEIKREAGSEFVLKFRLE